MKGLFIILPTLATNFILFVSVIARMSRGGIEGITYSGDLRDFKCNVYMRQRREKRGKQFSLKKSFQKSALFIYPSTGR